MTDLIDKLLIPSSACSLEVAIGTKHVRNKTELLLGKSQQCFFSFREHCQHTVLKHRHLEHIAGSRTGMGVGVGVGLNKNQFRFLLHHDTLSTSKVTPSSKNYPGNMWTFNWGTFCKNCACSAKTTVEKVRRNACRVFLTICSSSHTLCLSHRTLTERRKTSTKTRINSRNIIHNSSDTQAAHRS